MAAVKDYPTLIRAFARFAGQVPSARLVLVGGGGELHTCRQLADSLGVAEKIWMPGPREDIPELMRAMNVFVLPSLNEGISNTILEAQASGLPVIATAVGGNVELVEAGVNGLLVRPGDADGLAQALLTYFEHPALRERHGREARARVEARFSIPAMVRAYEAVYEKALAETGRHG
jgi:glycosyltransferase involved in cell wall biosynthesis